MRWRERGARGGGGADGEREREAVALQQNGSGQRLQQDIQLLARNSLMNPVALQFHTLTSANVPLELHSYSLCMEKVTGR